MIDLQAVRYAYLVQDISNVGFIHGPNNPADCLTKICKCHSLIHMQLTRKCDYIADQWLCEAEMPPYLPTIFLLYRFSIIGHAALTIYTHREASLLHISACVSMQVEKLYQWMKLNCSISLIEII